MSFTVTRFSSEGPSLVANAQDRSLAVSGNLEVSNVLIANVFSSNVLSVADAATFGTNVDVAGIVSASAMDLSGNLTVAGSLSTGDISSTNANIVSITTQDLLATGSATFQGPLSAGNVTASGLEATEANVATLISNSATLTSLSSSSAAITSLTGDSVSTTTLSATTSTTTYTQFGNTLASMEQFGNVNGINMSNKVARRVFGVINLGSSDSVTVTHNLNILYDNYTVQCMLSDTQASTQLVTLIVTNKTAQSFDIVCVPSNKSTTAMVDFVITELQYE